MNSILIPLDGSELAEAALDPGVRLAARHDAKVVLASVVSDLPPVPLSSRDGEAMTRWFAEEEERAARYLSDRREELTASNPALEIEARATLGPVARTLMDTAAEARAELIMLTTHGRGAWQRAWLGSVADALLRGAQRPLLLLREGDASARLFADERSPAHVLVPLDGSAAGEDVLGPLTSLLPGRDGRVTLLSVIRRPYAMATSYLPHAIEAEAVTDEQKERAREYLLEVAERWNPLGVQVDVHVLSSDDVAGSIFDFAETKNVDLLAMSTRGRGGVGRLVLGSVADKVIRGTSLPVLTVRRRDEEQA